MLGTIIAIVISVLSGVASYVQARKAQKGGDNGFLVTKADNDAGLLVIYGERRVGGVKVFKDINSQAVVPTGGRTVIGQNSGGVDATQDHWSSNRIWLDRVDVIGEGPIHSVTDVEIAGDAYTDARYGKKSLSHYRGIVMDGSDGQGWLSELGAKYSRWKSTSVGERVAYVQSRFRNHQENITYQGEPDIQYQVKGKLVWDPRKDTSYGGTGTHDLATESTWEWSDNPSLCLLDYLLADYGRGLDITDIDVPSFVTAADSCDTLVDVPAVLTNTTGSTITVYNYITGEPIEIPNGTNLPNYRTDQVGTQQKRLRCNAIIDPKDKVVDNVKKLLETMKGNLPYHQGKYSLKLEDTASSVMSFDTTDIIGGITFGEGDQSERFNRVTIKFPNRSKRYQMDQVSWPKLDSAQYVAYLAEDNNNQLWHEVDLTGVSDFYQAEDLAEFIVRNSRASLQCEIKVKSKAIMLQPADVVTITHATPGWTAKKFRVRGVKVAPDFSCSLNLTEYQDSVYQWGTKANEPDSPDVGLASVYDDLPALTGLAGVVARVDSADGVPHGLVTLTWDAVDDFEVEEYVLRYKQQSETVFQTTRYAEVIRAEGELPSVSFTAPQNNTTYDVYLHYTVTSSGRTSDVVSTTVVIPEYRTDLDIYMNNIELESGLALTNEAGDLLVRSDLSDLAVYNRDTEARLDSDIATAQTTVQSNLDAAEASLLAAQAAADLSLAAAQAGLVTAQADLVALQAEVDSNQTALQVELDAAEADIVTAEAAIVAAQAATTAVQSNLNTEVARIDGVTDGLQSTLEDLTASTADVYVQTTAPVAGVSGVPDPIAANSRWFDSDDSNHAYIWDGSTWVSIVDNRIGANQVAITDLEATVDDPVSGVAATSTALGLLDATVVALDGTVTSVASDLVGLTATVATTDGNVTANADATTLLDARVVLTEGSIVTQSADIVALESNLALTDGNVAANAGATAALTTRVESAEGTILVQSGDIVDLTANLLLTDGNVTGNAAATAALDVRVVAAEGSISSQAQDIVDLTANLVVTDGNVTGNADAISGLTVRVTDNEGLLSSQATSVTALEAELQFNVDILNEDGTNLTNEAGVDIDLENSLSAIVAGSSLATRGLDARVTETESGLVSQGESIISLESQITDPLLGLQAQSTATDVLTTRVETNEGSISSQAASILTLAADLASTDGNVTANSAATDALTVRVETTEDGVDVQGLSIEALEATVNNVTTGVAATAQALDVVEIAIVDTDTGLTASANRLDALELTVDNPTTGVSATAQALDTVELAIADTGTGLTASANRLDALELTVDDATTGVSATAQALDVVELAISDTGTGLSASAGRLDALELTVDDATTGVSATAQALDVVELAIADTGTGLSASAGRLDSLELTVNNATTGVAATAQALDAVEIAIADTGTGLTASANAIDALELTVNNATTGVAATAQALDTVELAIADTDTGLSASAGRLDALELTVDDASTGVAATAQALDAVELAIADTETGLAVSASQIDSLNISTQPAQTVYSSGQLSQAIPISADIAGAYVHEFFAASFWKRGAGFLHVALFNAQSDDVSIVYEGTTLSSTVGNSSEPVNTIEWFTFPITTDGTAAAKEISFWRDSGGSSSVILAIIVTSGGRGDPQSLFDGSLISENVTANAGSISTIELAINDTDTGLTASADAIDALELTVNNATTGVAATANALDAVELAIADTGTGLSASAGRLDALELTVDDATTGVAATAQALDVVELAIADTETGLSASANAIDALELTVNNVTTGVAATAAALDTVELAIADTETGLSASADAIDALELTVNNATTGVAATATALDAVELAIADTETGLSASATKIGALETTVDDPTTGLTTRVTATEAFETRIDTAEGGISDLSAEYNVRLDVDGNVAGFGLVAGATSSEFNVLANKFTIVDPAVPTGVGKVPFSVSGGVVTMQNVTINGNLVVDGSITNAQMGDNSVTSNNINVAVVSDISGNLGTVTAGTFQTSSGAGYRVEVSDTGDFPIWYGTGDKTAANGLFYVDAAGQVYVNAVIVAQAGSTIATFDVVYLSVFGLVAGGSSASATATAPTYTNGSGTYTYAWTRQVVLAGPTTTIDNAALETPTFTSAVTLGETSHSVWEVLVTDTVNSTTTRETVYVTLENSPV